ncbi:hypothetical protein AB1Y20_012409 [Prymnesium parvum]|uniref:Uncharacterized protein n=1 Tax=Prymnesium parvum TaxID=97485 RepID=A0AB34IKF6_PRYPA
MRFQPPSVTFAMNPQLHYTPQQQMGYGGYSVPCRVGNWAEDEYLGVLQTSEHVSRSASGTLSTQQIGNMISRATAPVTLASPPEDGFVRFGDALMISAAQGGALALNAYKKFESAQEGYVVSRTKPEGAFPCARTCWTVCPIGEAPPDGLLRVGMRFYLKTECDAGDMYLQSLRYNVANMNYASSISDARRKSAVFAVKTPGTEAAWEVAVIEPLASLVCAGQPVLANTFIALKHCSSQTNLSAEATEILTKFGLEHEVAVFTESSLARAKWGSRDSTAVGVTNHWAFTTGA